MRKLFAAVVSFVILSLAAFAEPGHAGFTSVSTSTIGSVSGSSLNISATRVTGDGSGLNITTSQATVSRTLADRSAERSSLLDFANVDASGVADSTSAIQTALGIVKNIYVPSGTYIVSNTAITSLTSLRGDATMGYGSYQGQSPSLTRGAGCSSMLNLGSSRAVKIEGLFLNGVDGSCAGIVGNNSSRTLLRDLTVYNTSGGLIGSGSYLHSVMGYNLTFAEVSGTAVANLVDSFLVGDYEAGGAGNGISQGQGANDSIFAIGKIEFKDGRGYSGFNSKHNILALQNIDRNGQAGVHLTGTDQLLIADNMLRRNGRYSSNTVTEDAHIVLENSGGTGVVGNYTDYGDDDGGGGYASPKTSLYVNSSAGADNIYVVGNDLRGSQGLEKIHMVGTPTNYVQIGNLGVAPEIRQDNNASVGMTRNIETVTSNTMGAIRIKVTGHGLSTSNDVVISGVSGTTEANGYWEVTRVDNDYFDLISSTYAHAYDSSGTVQLSKPNFYLVNARVGLERKTATLSAGTSSTITIHLPPLANFADPPWYDVEMRTRDNSTAFSHRTVVNLIGKRESGNASYTWGNLMGDETWFSVSGVKTGANIIVTLGSMSPDGSVLDMTVYNASANTQKFQLYVGNNSAPAYGATVSTTNVYGANVSGTGIYGSVVSGSVIFSGVGSASSPAIQIGDTNSGWYRSFDDILNLSTGGVERWRVSTSRFSSAVPIYVGDASTAPLASVHVGGPSASIIVHGVSGTAPFTCDSAHEGGMGWSLANHYGCVCDGTSWKQQASPASACVF